MRIFALAIIILFTLAPTALTSAQVQLGPGGAKPVQTGPGGAGTGENTTLINPLSSGTSLETLLTSILGFVIRIGSIVVVLMLVFVGYKFVVARGDPGAISEAKQMLLWTLIGALVLLGAQAIAVGIKATVQALSVGR